MFVRFNPVAMLSAVALVATVPACQGTVEEINVDEFNVAEDAEINAEVNTDVDQVEPGERVDLTLETEGVYLIAPTEEPPKEEAERAAHIEVYLDTVVGQEPLLVTAETEVTVEIPEDTEAGVHVLVCVLVMHDGEMTSVRQEVEITVTEDGGSDDSEDEDDSEY